MVRRALVFASGDFAPDDLAGFAPEDGDYVVCVDGGLQHCLATAWQPDILIGDFDSVSPDLLDEQAGSGVERLSFPTAKDQSDLELALGHLASLEVGQVVLTGVSGGRTDHMLFNWHLPLLQDWPFRLCLVDATVVASLVTSRWPCRTDLEPGRTVSLLALDRVQGLCTRGLRYSLERATLQPGSTLGLSNVAAGGEAGVEVASGRLLVLVQRGMQAPR